MTKGLSSMGFSLRAAIAAKLRIDPVVIVFCDNNLKRIELKQARRHYPSWGTLLEPVDIECLAAARGRREIDPSQYAAQF